MNDLAVVPASPAERPDSADLERFVAAWDAFFAAARRARGREARDPHAGLTLSQYHLVRPLGDGRSLPVGVLAEAAGVSGPTATRMLDALARHGIVRRERSAGDRRVVPVSLTATGRRALRHKQQRVEEKRRAVFAALSPAERQQGAAVLDRLAEVIDEL